jgi:hypothetical protein
MWRWWDFETYEVMQNLHQSTWDHEMLHSDRSSEDEQLLMRPLLRKSKKCEHYGRLKIKMHIVLYGEYSWTVTLRLEINIWFRQYQPFHYKNVTILQKCWLAAARNTSTGLGLRMTALGFLTQKSVILLTVYFHHPRHSIAISSIL